jgi:hypothetical protein
LLSPLISVLLQATTEMSTSTRVQDEDDPNNQLHNGDQSEADRRG